MSNRLPLRQVGKLPQGGILNTWLSALVVRTDEEMPLLSGSSKFERSLEEQEDLGFTPALSKGVFFLWHEKYDLTLTDISR